MKVWLLLMILALLVISGCTQTGKPPESNDTGESKLNLTPAEPPEPAQPEKEQQQPNLSYTDEECQHINCPPSEKICSDGSVARCGSNCSRGKCITCIPDCPDEDDTQPAPTPSGGAAPTPTIPATGGGGGGGGGAPPAPEPEPEPEPEPCQEDWVCTDWTACTAEATTQTRECIDSNGCGTEDSKPATSQPCEGNQVCDPGEYGTSDDCPDCEDGNVCTLDTFDYGAQECSNEPIDACCGNNNCDEGESHSTCPQDCPEEGMNYVVFSEVCYDPIGKGANDTKEEFIELYNPTDEDIVLNSYSLMDFGERKWSIPNGTRIAAKSFLRIAHNSEFFEARYGCAPDIEGLTIQLNNEEPEIIFLSQDPMATNSDMVAYNGYFNWDLTASTGKSLVRKLDETLVVNWTNWLSEQEPTPCD